MWPVNKGIPLTSDFANGGVSFWYRQIGLPARRPALPGPPWYDVAIVGGGYTGLWTAYYLKQAEPGLRIACWRRSSPGSAPRDATAGGCRPSSPARASARQRARPPGHGRPAARDVPVGRRGHRRSPGRRRHRRRHPARTACSTSRRNDAQRRPPARRRGRPARWGYGRTTCACSAATSSASGCRSPGRWRRRAQPARRTHPAGQAGRGVWRRGRRDGRRHLRGHRGDRDPPGRRR